MKGLKVQLLLVFSLLLTILLAGTWLWSSFALTRLAENQALAQLDDDCNALLSNISVDDRYKAKLQNAPPASLYTKANPHSFYSILIGQPQYGQQQFNSPSLGNAALPTPALDQGLSQKSTLSSATDHSILVFSKGYVIRGLPVTISTGLEMSEIDGTLLSIKHEGALVNVALLSIGLGVFWLISRRLLRPLDELQEELEEVVLGKTRPEGQKSSKTDTYEIQRLVNLAAQRLDRSKSAISSMSHLLKTPLSAIIQLANQPALASSPEVKNELITHATSIQRAIEYKLKNAQLAGAASDETGFNPSRELDNMVRALNSIYRHKGIRYDINVPNLDFLIDRQDGLELLGNLLDNASKWAKQTVRLIIHYEGQKLSILVEDDGPGCPEQELKLLSTPGMWLNEKNQGHGLGLSLIRNIAKLYSGTVIFGRSELLGGFSADIVLKCYRASTSPKTG